MEEFILLLILGFILLILLFSFRHQWVIISNTSSSSTPLPQNTDTTVIVKKQKTIIPIQNEAEPLPPCINNKYCCSTSTFGCCADNVTAKSDSIGINCIF